MTIDWVSTYAEDEYFTKKNWYNQIQWTCVHSVPIFNTWNLFVKFVLNFIASTGGVTSCHTKSNDKIFNIKSKFTFFYRSEIVFFFASLHFNQSWAAIIFLLQLAFIVQRLPKGNWRHLNELQLTIATDCVYRINCEYETVRYGRNG